MGKKAQLSGAPNTILAFVVLVIVIAIGGMVISGITTTTQGTTEVNSSLYNVTIPMKPAINQFGTFLPTIAIVLVAALLISVVVGAFMYMRQ